MASIDDDNEQNGGGRHADGEQPGARTPVGDGTPDEGGAGDGGAADDRPTVNRITIGGNATAPVIAGNHVAYIGAHHGSTVNVLVEGERPRPRRRTRVDLLPRRQSAPFGRAADLASIDAALRDGDTVQLWGPPGVGKSALLRHAARTLGAGPHGKLFLDAARREPEDLAQDVFEACHETHGYAPSRTEMRRLMAGMEVTVYVDNADYTAEQLRTVMDAAPDATFVFAARNSSLQGADGRAQRLTGIDRAAALELLARELGRPVDGPDRQDTAAALWETAAGTPLLLLRAAAVARLDPSGEAVLPKPGAVRELLPLLFDRLDDPSTRTLHLLATFGDVDLAPVHVGALTGTSDPAALCGDLARLGLARETERGYRVAPDVVGALRQRPGLVPYSLERLCAYFADWAARPTTGASQVADHAPALEALAELAERSGRADLAVRIVRAASPALARSLRLGAWGRLLDQGVRAARHAGDRRSEAYLTHERGIRNILTGNRALAAVLLVEAGVLWRQLGDTQGADAASAAQQYVPGQAPPADAGSGALPQGDAGATPDAGGATDGSGAGDPGGAGDAGGVPDGSSSAAGPAPAQDPGSASVDPSPAPDVSGAHDVSGAAAPDPASVPDVGSTVPDPASGTPDVGSAMPDPASAHGTVAQGTGMPVDPGTAASPGMVPPPGVVEGAGLGATTTGVTGTGIAAALKVAAVVAALVIGAVAVEQRQNSSDSGGGSPAVTVTESGRDGGAGSTGAAEGEPTPDPTGLEGVWLSSRGGGIEFVDAGGGTYSAATRDACGDTVTVRFTGSGSTYTSTAPVYDMADGSCGDILGEVTTTITINPDGDTADGTREMTDSVSDAVTCYDCTPFTLNRLS
ncbi:ATP-binding protein [Streptomyces sp. NPDC005925]|uniref:ATP-binding protein n=1 Tax=Streptomyces sp. NPDC005925 TaxID=3157172 RepID=UPI0033C9437C